MKLCASPLLGSRALAVRSVSSLEKKTLIDWIDVFLWIQFDLVAVDVR